METGQLKGVSVIVCCFNSAPRLPETLQHLAAQQVPAHIGWEIIIVDNASTDNTVQAAQEIWKLCNAPGSFRIVSEKTPGLSAARHKGYMESRYSYLLFCDDDNWLKPDYVHLAFEILEQHPDVAIAGGRTVAAFESQPPAWFEGVAKSYAVGNQYETTGDVTWRHEKLWGAGAVLQKQALDHLYRNDFEQLLSDRIGNKITSGGDHELCCAMRLAGYRLYYDERLVLTHFITNGRLKWDWFIRFYRSASRTSIYFDAYNKAAQRPTGFKDRIRQGVVHEMYLSVRKIMAMRPGINYLFKTPGPGAEKRWLIVFFEKNRLRYLLGSLFSYRSMLNKVKKSKWILPSRS